MKRYNEMRSKTNIGLQKFPITGAIFSLTATCANSMNMIHRPTSFLTASKFHTNKLRGPHSASEPYWPSDRQLLAKFSAKFFG
jgi:hypothetical protein